MKERILSHWNVIRFIRLVIGAGAVVQGILQKETILTVAGFFLLLGAVLNYGCCGSAGCPVSYSKKQKEKDIDYEEVDNSK
jgi:hypothetical protein